MDSIFKNGWGAVLYVPSANLHLITTIIYIFISNNINFKIYRELYLCRKHVLFVIEALCGWPCENSASIKNNTCCWHKFNFGFYCGFISKHNGIIDILIYSYLATEQETLSSMLLSNLPNGIYLVFQNSTELLFQGNANRTQYSHLLSSLTYTFVIFYPCYIYCITIIHMIPFRLVDISSIPHYYLTIINE